jgi:hypothetical protein
MVKRKSRLSRKSASQKKTRLEPSAVFHDSTENFEDYGEPSEEGDDYDEFEGGLDLQKMKDDALPPVDLSKDMKHDFSSPEEKHLSMNTALQSIQSDLKEEFVKLKEEKEKLGGFMHEVIYLDDHEDIDRNRKAVSALMKKYPDENIMLNVTLHDVPDDSKPLHGTMRADDFMHSNEVAVAFPDGDVLMLNADRIRSIVSVVPHAAPLEMPKSSTGMGGFGIEPMPAGGSDVEDE